MKTEKEKPPLPSVPGCCLNTVVGGCGLSRGEDGTGGGRLWNRGWVGKELKAWKG